MSELYGLDLVASAAGAAMNGGKSFVSLVLVSAAIGIAVGAGSCEISHRYLPQNKKTENVLPGKLELTCRPISAGENPTPVYRDGKAYYLSIIYYGDAYQCFQK